MVVPIIVLVAAGVGAYFAITKNKGGGYSIKQPERPFPEQWRMILVEKVAFYNALSIQEKVRFEYKVHQFLLNHRISGVDIKVDITDKILVASGAVIPIFSFQNWHYHNLKEVFLFPSAFNKAFKYEGPDRRIIGLVGHGFMEGKMILSKPSLHLGFSNDTDKKNVAVHEFVHLIDKMDGHVDGIPKVLMNRQYAIPWLSMIKRKIEEINLNESDINPYGGVHEREFFAVISEYFFERPGLLEKKHPELYNLLEKMFKHDMSERRLFKTRINIGRNDPCPCDSGLKFKKCCGA